MAAAIISLPAAIRRGDIVTVRALIQHPMETGYRRDAGGILLPRDLIRRFTCHVIEGDARMLAFSAELHAAIAANPLIAFSLKADRDCVLEFQWSGDNGFVHRESRSVRFLA
ncbi:MAG: thiosulfate oxidation carrier complex protein SoxZ [Betaproteobacteria bacterium]|nr:thiosulfate oxidation carrier complex protein SoxZ [Betaproteobacteria bacterium]